MKKTLLSILICGAGFVYAQPTPAPISKIHVSVLVVKESKESDNYNINWNAVMNKSTDGKTTQAFVIKNNSESYVGAALSSFTSVKEIESYDFIPIGGVNNKLHSGAKIAYLSGVENNKLISSNLDTGFVFEITPRVNNLMDMSVKISMTALENMDTYKYNKNTIQFPKTQKCTLNQQFLLKSHEVYLIKGCKINYASAKSQLMGESSGVATSFNSENKDGQIVYLFSTN